MGALHKDPLAKYPVHSSNPYLLSVLHVLRTPRLAIHRGGRTQCHRVALRHEVGGEGGGVRLLEGAVAAPVRQDAPVGRRGVRVRRQGIRVAGGGRHGAGGQAALEVVRLADEQLEDVVEDVAGARRALGKVGAGQEAHGFAWKRGRLR